nr:acyl carrier protein [Providencia rettgeri]
MSQVHQQWLENTIYALRAYSGIKLQVTMDSSIIEDLHIDSLEMLELITEIERYTGFPLLDEIWMKWRYLRDIVNYLLSVKWRWKAT